jgi:hypothetical protein
MPFDPQLLYRSDVKYVDNAKGVTLTCPHSLTGAYPQSHPEAL